MFRSFVFRWLIPRIGQMLIWCIARTLRWRLLDLHHFDAAEQPNKNVIFAFWHNRLVMMPYLHRRLYKKTRRIAVLVSQSRDGQIIADIIERFGFKAVRGSTTRGGKAALREMIRTLKSGLDAGFTPDGPRGPRYEAGPGVVVLSHLTGLPIIPICWDVSHKLQMKSWDRLIIPLPFSRAVFVFGEPIEVGRDANPNMLQEKVLEVKTALLRLTDRCALELVVPDKE